MEKDLSQDIAHILALDPGTSCGYAIFYIKVLNSNVEKERKKIAEIIEYGFLDISLESDYQGDHCIDLMNQVKGIIVNHKITTILVEDYFFSKFFTTGCNVNVSFRTAIHIQARLMNIPYAIINISNWKKHITGSTKPSKKQIELWGAKNAKKYYVQEALWEKYKIQFPDHSFSKKNANKPIAFRMDIVDATAQGIFYCEKILGIESKDIICCVKPPKNINKKRTTTFQYDI